MLTARQANQIAKEAETTESHIQLYLNYLLDQVQSAAKRNEYDLTVFSTRSDVVTSKVIDNLIKLGYEAEMITNEHGNIEIHIAWEK